MFSPLAFPLVSSLLVTKFKFVLSDSIELRSSSAASQKDNFVLKLETGNHL